VTSTAEMVLVAEANHPIELLLTVQEELPDVVIMSAVATDDPPPICTHLLTEFPDLLVISICPKTHRATTYRSAIETDTLPGTTLRDVISTIRSLSWHV